LKGGKGRGTVGECGKPHDEEMVKPGAVWGGGSQNRTGQKGGRQTLKSLGGGGGGIGTSEPERRFRRRQTHKKEEKNNIVTSLIKEKKREKIGQLMRKGCTKHHPRSGLWRGTPVFRKGYNM